MDGSKFACNSLRDDGVYDWSNLDIEAAIEQNRQRKDADDSVKRIGNHSIDEGMQMDMALNKNPLNGRLRIIV